MAQRRMFSKSITNSDEFIDMPDSAQNLYFHLSMNADDDGFVNNWKNIMRMTGHKEDDIKILIAKQYIIPFESGVIVIRHWRINNYLRNDRKTPTRHQAELERLYVDEDIYELESAEKSTMLPSGIPLVDTGKDRIGNIIPPLNPNGVVADQTDQRSECLEEDYRHDFEILWEAYPRKEGKADAYKHYKSWMKGKVTPFGRQKLTNEQMLSAIEEYKRTLKDRNITEKKYIKMGDTFFNNAILDYLPKEE